MTLKLFITWGLTTAGALYLQESVLFLAAVFATLILVIGEVVVEKIRKNHE